MSTPRRHRSRPERRALENLRREDAVTAAGLRKRTGRTDATVLGGGPTDHVGARGRRPTRGTKDIRP
ncbi:hypothetical protein HUT15_36190 (plasmid) [Streptomyces sp. NA03103]|uniref:hypothetical protein n=1 Tax=unclassified Streptomyces TaxID=2593676 RepID=UPI001590B52C|nr:hypothetical protein [Streptomyces sp. NA03103]QKW65984.1 hypothetical protein HUT15_36190 [Streptomyces sp. NA03103]